MAKRQADATSRLYQRKSSNIPYEQTFAKVYPFSQWSRPELEYGDKIVLPSSALKDINRLKLEYPLLFEVRNTKVAPSVFAKKRLPGVQYCSVIEFAAPEDTVYMPKWMMSVLMIREGRPISVKSLTNIPMGTFCRIQPKSEEFMKVANPRVLLEKSLEKYSMLFKGAVVLVKDHDQEYIVRVVDTQPADVVCVVGSVDLEVDIQPPEAYTPTPDDILPIKSLERKESDNQEFASNERESDQDVVTNTPLAMNGFSTSVTEHDTDQDIPAKDSMASPTASAGHVLKSTTVSDANEPLPEGSTLCDNCRSAVPSANFSMHQAFCFRNIRPCKVCKEPVRVNVMDEHMQSVHAQVTCECGSSMENRFLNDHKEKCAWHVRAREQELVEKMARLRVEEERAARERREEQERLREERRQEDERIQAELVQRGQDGSLLKKPDADLIDCPFCEMHLKPATVEEHLAYCGTRTDKCFKCNKWVRLRDMENHIASGCVEALTRSRPSSNASSPEPSAETKKPAVPRASASSRASSQSASNPSTVPRPPRASSLTGTAPRTSTATSTSARAPSPARGPSPARAPSPSRVPKGRV
eukprot:GILK01005054.1.p1 GENE.GILK01005054.1~~GILK01005054.1.p1  ORF type:complete len:586 (-),score=110.80 GILK01005054.1:126-1883(-)